MTSTCNISLSPSPFAVIPSEDDQQHQLYTARNQASSSSNSLIHSIQDHGGCYPREPHQLKYIQEANNFTSQGGGSQDHLTVSESERDQGSKLKLPLRKKEDGHNQNQSDSAKWMSSKMRLVRKMMMNSASTGTAQQKLEEDVDFDKPSPLETDSSSNSSSVNSSSNPIRVCADCNTNKTPLWRSGPRGPKSLCNACGIRQRKARRAMAAANGIVVAGKTSSVVKTKVQHKDKMKRSNNCDSTQYPKISKLASTSYATKNKVCFDDFLLNLSNNLAFHRVFPQDEKEAAILLMALSCGIVRS